MIIDQFITTAARRKKAPKEMIMISKSNKTVRDNRRDPAIIQLRLGEDQPAKTKYYVSEFNGHYQTTRGTWLDCSTYL